MQGPGAVLFDVNGNPLTTFGDGSLAVTIMDGYVTLTDAAVSVTNFPAVQPVSGTVAVSNFPAFPASQTINGAVTVSNFPATQPISGSVTLLGTSAISGSVSVSNFPAFPATQVVSGTVSVSDFPAVQPVSGTVAVSNFPAFPAIQAVSQSGAPWSVQTNKASTSSVTQVTPSTTVQTLLAANASRVSAHMSNGSSKNLYVKLGTAASLTSYTDIILPGDAYDVPDTYTGIITGLWATGVNAVALQCTELLP